ncbi:MAG: sulfite exporter TauE/SafE family protein [Rhodospirillales bacterium]
MLPGMIGGYEVQVLAIITGAFLLAGLIKGVIGVGTPLVVLPIGSLLLPPTVVMSFLIVPIVAANAYQLFSSAIYREAISRFWPAATAQLIAATITSQLLIMFDPESMKLVLGIAICVFGLMQIVRIRLEISEGIERRVQVGVGTVAGGIGGVTGIHGPLLMVMLFTLKASKDMFVTAMAMFFLVSYLPLFSTLTFASILGWEELFISLAVTVPLILGVKFGERFRGGVSQELFRKLIGGVLILMGINLVWSTLGAG